MTVQTQKKLFGALVFLISLTVYLLTLAPTASFWDCSEFITCAYKLEVGHAPGAPVYMLLGRLFSLFAGGNVQNVAWTINALSAVASALTVMFLFQIIYWFVQKFIFKIDKENSNSHFISVAASLIGALAYAFSDSFWFSAVEAEVYATSSMFSAFVFWCIIKYEQEPKGWAENRWIILIFFLLGLSVGIHLLNLLALPAMALVVYFKHKKYSVKGILLTILVSVLLIVVFIYVVIPGIVKTAAYFDLLFVNSLHMPVYSGALFFIVVLIFSIPLLMNYFEKNQKHILRFSLLVFSFWLIGYSSFTILVIRSNDNPFVDINNVENVFGLVDYLNREQYPQRPLVYGNNYNSPITGSHKRLTYKMYDGKYFQDELNPKYEFDAKTLTLFPRMASIDNRHADLYKQWVNIKGRKVKIKQADGTYQSIRVPTFIDNFKFFVKYQVGYMYLRYFMWNFVGKQNDTQGVGNAYNGNWILGISFFDNWRLGLPDNQPDDYKNSKTRNRYFMLPLILGIIGLLYQLKHDKNNFWIAFILFFITGPAIIIYLNEVPITPRERDYVHVGSFLVFALWIGLGAAAIIHRLSQLLKWKYSAWLTSFILLLLLPGIMVSENYNDHNRSHRYLARDFGKNMLSSCEQNSILFTTADNDTYPLWYLQQVEGFRTDVRQVLTTFLPVDWYGNQLNIEHEGSGKVPVSFHKQELLMKNDPYLPVVNRIDTSIDIKEMVNFIKSNNSSTKVRNAYGEELNFIPGNKLKLAVYAQNFLKQSEYLKVNPESLASEISFSISKKYLTRDNLLMLDILANNNWERPVYVIYPSLFQEIGLADYLHREGMLYRFLPYKNSNILNNEKQMADHQYSLITEEFKWGNVNKSEVFIDHTCKQMVGSFRFRQMFADIANQLIKVNEHKKAESLIDLEQQIFPNNRIAYNYFSPDLVKIYYQLGATEKANTLVTDIQKQATELLAYYVGNSNASNNVGIDQQLQFYLLQQLIQITERYNSNLHQNLVNDFEKYYKKQLALRN